MKNFSARRLLAVLLFAGLAQPAFSAPENPDAARVREIAGWLSPQPAGFGQPITNRAAWDELLARQPELQKLVVEAEKKSAQPLPEQPDALYLDYSKTGNRDRWQSVANERRGRIHLFAEAEGLENQGRFLKPLEETIAAVCAEKTWVMPAHDPKLKNFHGETVEIDLGAAMLGFDLATADWLLGEKLSPATRRLIRENLERRIFTPYRAAVRGERPEFWWMRGQNNWNAVCAAGVTGAALTMLPSADDRAWFIAVAEKNVRYYLAGGFAPDGYCVEGLGYWNYGFGHYCELAEIIREATGGQLDLLELPPARQPALFGLRAEILNGVYPAIADCHPDEKPASPLMWYLGKRLGLDASRWSRVIRGGMLYDFACMEFLPTNAPVLAGAQPDADLDLRSWFPIGGVLICRPGAAVKNPLAVCIKGGHNGVSHGHNDLGSFSVVAGTNMLICDPGGEVYTARTFSSHRYESKLLNSFGHAVPVVAGKLQSAETSARAVVVAANFTAAADTVTFNLRSVYPVKDLEKLERTFVYSRGESPALEVRDEVKFSTPETFETALVSWGKFRQTGTNEMDVVDAGSAIHVTMDTQGRAFHWTQETIDENHAAKRKPVRLGIVLDEKVSAATVIFHIRPVEK